MGQLCLSNSGDQQGANEKATGGLLSGGSRRGEPEFPTAKDSKWWQRRLRQRGVEAPVERTVDPELRQHLLSEHIIFFNEKLLEVESGINAESASLGSIRDALRQQRDTLELEIGTHEFERASLRKDDSDLLEQLTVILIGPVKNLGDYS